MVRGRWRAVDGERGRFGDADGAGDVVWREWWGGGEGMMGLCADAGRVGLQKVNASEGRDSRNKCLLGKKC